MARNLDVIIVGAGMAGSTAALTLKSMGFHVQVVDKGRGYGGRMATRRISGNYFDHGAQFITPTPFFRDWLETHLPSSHLKEIFTPENSSNKKNYFYVEGMNAVSKKILENINTELNIKIAKIKRSEQIWELSDEDGNTYSAPQVLITAPIPQALTLLEQNNIEYNLELKKIKYRQFLILLITTRKPVTLPLHDTFSSKIVEGIFNNQRKGLPGNTTALTVVCDENFSTINYEKEDDLLKKEIQKELQSLIPNLEIAESQLKRWKYGLPKNTFSQMYFKTRHTGLYLAGDGFGGPHLEGAFRSGLAVSYIIKDDIIY